MCLQALLINYGVFLLQVSEADFQIIEEKFSVNFQTVVANSLM